MTNDYHSEDLAVNNHRSLRRLERAITMSQGQFSLNLVCCNSPSLRQQVVNQLQEASSFQIQKLILHPSVNTLFTTILTAVEGQQPPALIVLGLESVIAIEQVLSATNLVRDEFRKNFAFPLVLCINDEILHKMIRLAPDFKNWAANPIRFEVPKKQWFARAAITA
ncbi:MAG TPA: hypothetical protein V6D14_29560 [Coleofasciculaceae cyanobacterium]|jgi:hypothetical protein